VPWEEQTQCLKKQEDLIVNTITPLHGQTSSPREKVLGQFFGTRCLCCLFLDKSAQLGIHLVAEPMRGGSGVLRRGGGSSRQKVVLGERVHRLGASSQILREMVLVVVLRLGRGLLGGGRRVG